MPRRTLITQAEYARRRGVSRNAVHAAVRDGRITLVNGLVVPQLADRQWAENTDPSKPRGVLDRGCEL